MQSLLFILHNNYHGALPTFYYGKIYYSSGFICCNQYPRLKKGYASLQNILRKVKKGNYKKCKCNMIRGIYLKPKDLEKEKRQLEEMNIFL